MSQNNEQRVQNTHEILPTVGSCYKNGWLKMWKYILELLLIIILAIVVSIPSWGTEFAKDVGGAGAVFLFIFSLAYSILICWPIDYGVSFACLKAARGDKLHVKDMFEVFKNYWNAVLANLLVVVIVGIGMVLLIVPGIIFACKLAFVPYLIVERKMEVIEAVKQSWSMTKGYALKVFLMALLAIPIAIAGLLVCGVGIIASIIWISVAFASLYNSVSILEKSSQQKIVVDQ